MSRSLSRGLALLVGITAACGCAPIHASEGVRAEIRHRPLSLEPDALAQSYREERAYIRERRVASGRTRDLSALTAVAFSGGGIRSATFGLGVLQALDEAGIAKQLDYMSAASGGGFLATWVQAHLGADRAGGERGAGSFAELLADDGPYVEHLRGQSRFLLDEGLVSGPKLFLRWLAPIPLTSCSTSRCT